MFFLLNDETISFDAECILEIFHISMLMRFQLGKLNVPAVQAEAGIQLCTQ